MTHSATRTRLGAIGEFADLPAKITQGARTFFLVRDNAGYRLLSSVCPHQGGEVSDRGTSFECPLHGWRFDRVTGRCLNAPSKALSAVPVFVDNGVLYAELPGEGSFERVRKAVSVSKPGLSVHLHAHACLEISYEGFTILTDPWLDGPAFMGAWAQYPPADASGAELHPDAILITHEHSDHFHEPTLRHFDRGTPVYVPDFPNRRLPARLAALGFTNVTALPFGHAHELHAGWRVTCLEAESYWNDAFALIDIEGFKIFDVNDAGVNHRIARMVAPVDVLAVQFSAGASGYPWTWAHMTDDQKVAISVQACAGKLKLVREAAQLYGAAAVLPFASHFTLWHPTHARYARLMKRNTLADVQKALADLDVDVIDLLPGETWNVGKGLIHHSDDRDDWFQPPAIESYMDGAVDAETFASHHPADESLSRRELVDYLERLNDVPDIVHCEDLSVRIQAPASSGERGIDVSFQIDAGHLTILPSAPDRANLDMEIPLGVLTSVIREGLSWDEAFIGYWCRFDRHPNVYHAGFWRLFQAPYLKRQGGRTPSAAAAINAGSTIAEVLEAHGPDADRIFRRYGLFCLGCDHSTAESIEMGARNHGVNPRRVEQLLRELNSAFSGEVVS